MAGITNIDQVRQVDCTQYLRRYINFERGERTPQKARCPFHNERTASFAIWPDHFYCFGCKKSGDVFTFVQEYRHVEFIEAVEIVAEENGITVEYSDTPKRAGPSRGELREALSLACSHYRDQLQKCEDAKGYLADRGFSERMIDAWWLGYAKGDSVVEAADRDLLKAAGVVKERRDGSGVYDPLSGRVVIPHTDRAGRVVGFNARALPRRETGPKYMSTAETRLNKKGMQLFGYARAVEKRRKAPDAPPWVVLEGELSVIAAQSAGYAAVAPCGSTLTDHQARVLQGFPVWLAYDRDEAGMAATAKVIPLLRGLGLDVRVACLERPEDAPESATDPDDLLSAELPIRYTSEGIVQWAVKNLLDPCGTGESYADKLIERVMPLVAHRSAAVTWAAEDELARLAEIPASILRGDSRRMREELERDSTPAKAGRPRVVANTVERVMYATVLLAPCEPTVNWWQSYIDFMDLPRGALDVLYDIASIRRAAQRRGVTVNEYLRSGSGSRAERFAKLLDVRVDDASPAALMKVLDQVYEDEHLRRLKNDT